MREMILIGPSGAGSQLLSLSLPGEIFLHIDRKTAVRVALQPSVRSPME